MFIDTHMHECTFSKDSFLHLEQIVSIAKMRGLDGVCITDHDQIGLVERAKEYSKEVDFPIFVGVEYLSKQGDIIAFGVDEVPATRIEAQEFIDQVNQAGGACFSAHPFRNNNRGLEEHLAKVHGLHGIEVLNGSTSPEANFQAALYARQLGCAAVGSSDCHVPDKIGVYATYFQDEITSTRDLIQALKAKRTMPAYYTPHGYQVWDMSQPLRVQKVSIE